MKTFSTDWTNEERIKIVILLASQIQADIPAGNYGAPLTFDDRGVPLKFRPNMQSIAEVLMMPAEILEENRVSFEDLIWETAQAHGETDREKILGEFFSVTLEEARGRVYGPATDPEVIAKLNSLIDVERLNSAILNLHGDANTAQTCRYEVQTRDDLVELCLAASTSTEGTDELLAETKRLNQSESIEDFWVPGQNVILPRAVCLELIKRDKKEMH
jgi:hypothetical protein